MNENESMLARGARLGVVLFALLLALAALLMALATPAQARTVINERLPVSGTEYNPCHGEPFAYEATFHLLGEFHQDASGGSHGKVHVNAHGKGESPSGAKYVINGEGNLHYKYDHEYDHESADNYTDTMHFNFIRQGEDGTEDDLKAQAVTHVTENANGELTAHVVNFEFECQ